MKKSQEIKNPNSGEFILEHLKKWGSDVKQPHEFTFWLYFPDEVFVKRAGQKAEKAGFEVEISQPMGGKDDPGWLCLLFCPHIPDEDLLNGISEFCMQLAKDFDGKFDGWESRLELPEGISTEDFLQKNDLSEIKNFPI